MQSAPVAVRVFNDLSNSTLEKIGNIPDAVFSKRAGEHPVTFKLWVPLLRCITHDEEGVYIKTLPKHIAKSGLTITASRNGSGVIALRAQINAPVEPHLEDEMMEDLENAIDISRLRSELIKAVARWRDLNALYKNEPSVARSVTKHVEKIFKSMEDIDINGLAGASRASMNSSA